MTDIRTGAIALVVNTGARYSNYVEWIGLKDVPNNYYPNTASMKEGMVVEVLNVAPHGRDASVTLALVRSVGGQDFVIGITGLKFLRWKIFPFDPSKPVKTRGGGLAQILACDGPKDRPIQAKVWLDRAPRVMNYLPSGFHYKEGFPLSHDLVNIGESNGQEN